MFDSVDVLRVPLHDERPRNPGVNGWRRMGPLPTHGKYMKNTAATGEFTGVCAASAPAECLLLPARCHRVPVDRALHGELGFTPFQIRALGLPVATHGVLAFGYSARLWLWIWVLAFGCGLVCVGQLRVLGFIPFQIQSLCQYGPPW